jgi:hypothetical protein
MRYTGTRGQTHRTYLYYSTDPAAHLKWWGPGVYEINGNEPNVEQLSGNRVNQGNGLWFDNASSIVMPYRNGGTMRFRTNTHWDSQSGIDLIGGAGEFRMSSDSGNLNLRVDGWLYASDVSYGSRFIDINDGNYYADPASTSYFNDMRANIYYDRDNTSYYANPGQTSYFNDIRTNIIYDRENTAYYFGSGQGDARMNTARAWNFYADDWFRNYNSGEGMYNQNTGMHWYSDSGNYWNVAPPSSRTGAIRFRQNYGSTIRGYVYAENNDNFGLLDRDGNWAVRIERDDYVEFRDNDEVTFRIGQTGVDGNYGTVQTHGGGKGGWEGYSINGRYVFMSADNNQVGIYNDIDNEWMLYASRNGSLDIYHNGTSQLSTQSYGVYVRDQVRAAVYYDHDTAYRIDGNGDSRLWQLGVGYGDPRKRLHVIGDHGNSAMRVTLASGNNGAGTGEVNLQMWASEPGNTWDWAGFGYNVDNSLNSGGGAYYFGRPNTNFGQAYMRFSTAGHTYFYNTDTGGTRRTNMEMYSSGYIYVNNYLQAGNSLRAPIFYDTDTNYYFNGNSTSVMDTIEINSWIRHRGDTNTYIQFHASDQWRVVTGGSERLEVNNSQIYATRVFRCTQDVIAYYSDERLKTKKGRIGNALSKLLSLDGFYYETNDLAKGVGFDEEGLQVGLSAQQVRDVMPEVVHLAPFDSDYDENGNLYSTSGEEYLTVKYDRLVPLVIEGIKDQNKIVSWNNSKVKKLEGIIEKQQNEIEELKNLVKQLIDKG